MRGTVCTSILLTLGLAIGGNWDWVFGQKPAKSTTAADSGESPKSAMAGKPLKELTNGIGMKFKLIPAGEFIMGSDEGFGRSVDSFSTAERPKHKVRISKPFYMGVTEVTQEQYERVMGENSSYFSKSRQDALSVKGMETNYPAGTVSWHDAVDFCLKLSAGAGHTYRLPTEAEWEYACRAESTLAYCFGDDKSHLDDYAWWGAFVVGGSCLSEKHAHRVGQKKANRFGLYDLHGNVWEWCSDWYGMDYYAKSPLVDPAGPTTGSYRVCRGGSWHSTAANCRSAYRSGYVPTYRSSDVGFRVVAVPKDTPARPKRAEDSKRRAGENAKESVKKRRFGR